MFQHAKTLRDYSLERPHTSEDLLG